MPDIASLVRDLMTDGSVVTVANNPAAQFGMGDRAYLGPTLLPERNQAQNAYRETDIRYRTVIANAGARYSPAQKKGSQMIGSMMVELGTSDITTEFDSHAYDALIKVVGNVTMEAAANLIRWLDTTINMALVEYNEVQRWQAIVGALVQRRGDNGYTEDVVYPNPAGHRVTAGGVWSNNSYDPFADILAGTEFLEGKGFTVNRIITGRQVLSKLSNNNNVKTRTGVATISATGQITATAGRASRDSINGVLGADGLPPIELYNLQYRTQTGSAFFLPRDAFVMLCTTGRNMDVDVGDAQIAIPDALGYVGVGLATGQSVPGRKLRMEAKEDKPPRIIGEGWQESLPVIQDPEAIFVISGIS